MLVLVPGMARRALPGGPLWQWDMCPEVRQPQGHGCSQPQQGTKVALGSRSPSVGFSPILAMWEPGRNE